jgi:DNA-binding transcriptional MerR regulator
MDNEYRAQILGSTDQAADSSESSAEPGVSDNITIGELARESGVTLRALRFYQSKGLLAPQRNGCARVFSREDRRRLTLILQGKRLGFTLTEIHEMLAARAGGCTKTLPISHRKCVEQINLLERQRHDIDRALTDLRKIYAELFVTSGGRRATAGKT